MSKNIEYLDIKDVKVPMIYLKNDRLPKVDIQIIFKNAGKNTSHKAGLSYIVSKILSSGTMKKDESEFYENLESRAIYFGAKVLILDEPTSALGQKQQMEVLKTIKKVQQLGNIAIIF